MKNILVGIASGVLMFGAVITPAFAANTVSYATIGSGATANQNGSSAELFTPAGGVGSAYVRLSIDGGIPISTITSLTYTAQITHPGAGGYAPEVILNIDTDGDGTLGGTGINWMLNSYNPATLAGDNFLSGDESSPTKTTVESTPSSINALGNYSYWAANDARTGFGSFYSPFLSIPLPVHGIDATDRVYSIDFVVGTSGNFDGMRVLLSSVELNGTTYPVIPPDTTPPSTPDMLGFKNPNVACGGVTNSHFVTVDWSDSTDASGIAGYEYYVDYPLADGSGRAVWNPSTLWTSSENYGSLNEGIHHIKVRAKDNAGNYSDWTPYCDITADWTAPDVMINNPPEGIVSGVVDIRGTVTDANPHHYWLAIYNSSNTMVAGPGTVLRSDSFTDESLMSWDTTTFSDGVYVIKLEARDAANNKDTGSVDWHTVTVKNTPTNKDECKDNGWMLFFKPLFKNQGQCVSYIQANDNAGKQ